MRRLFALTQKTPQTAVAILLYAALRAGASIGRPVARFADSTGYETLRFAGSIDRFWPVPLVYHLVQSDTMRVAAQVTIGVLAWSWLSLVVARTSRFPLAVLSAVLIVGLTPQVIRYDLVILSESLGISFAAMAVAATVSLMRSSTNAARIIWCVSMTLCAMTRPVNLVVLFACAGWCVIRFIKSSRLTLAVPTAVLGLLAVWGIVLLQGNNSTSMLNLYTVLAERVVPDDGRYAWFVAHGMPDVVGLRQSDGYDFGGPFEPALADVVTMPTGQVPPAIIRAGGVPLATWVRDHGWRTYARYVLLHPADSWSRVSRLASPTLSPRNDDFLPVDSRSIVPRAVFGDWRAWTLVGLAAMAIALLRSRSMSMVKAMSAMYALVAIVYVAGLFTSGIEHARHSVTVAVLLRVLPLVALAVSLPARTLTERDGFDDAPS